MAVKLRPSKDSAMVRSRNESIHDSELKRLEASRNQLAVDKVQKDRDAAETVFKAYQKTLRALHDVRENVSNIDVLQPRINLDDRPRVEASKAVIDRAHAECQSQYRAAQRKFQQEEYALQQLKAVYQQSLNAAAAANQAIPAQSIDRFIELSGGKLAREGPAELDMEVSKLLSANPPGLSC
jgi:hypothetical protein